MRFSFTALAIVLVAGCSISTLAQTPECTRGEPEPVFRSDNPAVQSESFKRVSSHEATEEVIFKAGDRLMIRNWGCDAFTLTFRWESKTFSGSEPFPNALQVLRKLAALKADAVFDLSRAADGLDKLLKRGERLKQGEQYPVDGDPGDADFQLKFALRSSGIAASGSRYVEFDLTLGPL